MPHETKIHREREQKKILKRNENEEWKEKYYGRKKV